jgi:hypothetical protein
VMVVVMMTTTMTMTTNMQQCGHDSCFSFCKTWCSCSYTDGVLGLLGCYSL